MYLATSTSYPAEQKITVSDDWHGCIMFSLEYWDSFVRHSFSFCVVSSPPLTVILLALFALSCISAANSCKDWNHKYGGIKNGAYMLSLENQFFKVI